jgi:hypothetical protein
VSESAKVKILCNIGVNLLAFQSALAPVFDSTAGLLCPHEVDSRHVWLLVLGMVGRRRIRPLRRCSNVSHSPKYGSKVLAGLYHYYLAGRF